MAQARGIGPNATLLNLEDNSSTFLESVHYNPTSINAFVHHANKAGRVSFTRHDETPLEVEIKGVWADRPSTGLYWRDFKSLLEGIRQQIFDCGDGTELRMVDYESLTHTRMAGMWRGMSAVAGHNEVWAYVLKLLSYEPFGRAKAPALINAGAITTGNGSNATTFNIPYVGTAIGEPTWQLTFVIPALVSVTGITLVNYNTGEIVAVPGAMGQGTWVVTIDSSGTIGAAAPGTTLPSPNNNSYNVLTYPSLGYGVTINGIVDSDFQGTPPTLAPGLTLPPASVNNLVQVILSATGVCTSATLAYICPARYRR